MLKRSMIVLVLSMLCINKAHAAEFINLNPKPEHDSRELQIQDMLVLQLLPNMHDKLADVYKDVLTVNPEIYPYLVDVIKTDRVNGFRGFDLRITLQAVPTVGPHIPVGEDRFTYQISPVAHVKLLQLEHLKGPNKEDFPPNYQDLLR